MDGDDAACPRFAATESCGVLAMTDERRDAYDRDYAAAEHLRLAADALRDSGCEGSRVQQALALLVAELDAIAGRWN